MMKQSKTTLLFAVLMAAACGAASAQDGPSVQSCAGLLCDMGILGHKVASGPNGEPPSPAQMAAAEAADPHRLPCHDFLCRAFGGKEGIAAAPPPAQPVATAAPEKPVEKPATSPRKIKHKHMAKHMAKAETPAMPANAVAK